MVDVSMCVFFSKWQIPFPQIQQRTSHTTPRRPEKSTPENRLLEKEKLGKIKVTLHTNSSIPKKKTTEQQQKHDILPSTNGGFLF